LHSLIIEFVTGRCGQHELHTDPGAQRRQRQRYVVAIPHERHGAAGHIAAELILQRHHVRQGLAGVAAVAEGVDHRHVADCRHLHQLLVLEHPRHDAVDHAAEHLGDVGGAFPHAELHIFLVELDAVAAEFVHRLLEADPRPQGGLFEEHRQRPARQQRRGLAG
jgi:hypothetical protein